MRPLLRSLLGSLLVLLVSAVGLLAPPLAAAQNPELHVLGHPASPQITNWATGTSRYWRIEAWVSGLATAKAQVRLAGTGALVSDPQVGLLVQVLHCSQPWSDTALTVRPSCPGSSSVVVQTRPLQGTSTGPADATAALSWPLPNLTKKHQHLLVELIRPARDPASSVAAGTARFGVGIYAAGEPPEVQPAVEENPQDDGSSGGLPDAGGPRLWWTVAGGLAVVVGLRLTMRRRA